MRDPRRMLKSRGFRGRTRQLSEGILKQEQGFLFAVALLEAGPSEGAKAGRLYLERAAY